MDSRADGVARPGAQRRVGGRLGDAAVRASGECSRMHRRWWTFASMPRKGCVGFGTAEARELVVQAQARFDTARSPRGAQRPPGDFKVTASMSSTPTVASKARSTRRHASSSIARRLQAWCMRSSWDNSRRPAISGERSRSRRTSPNFSLHNGDPSARSGACHAGGLGAPRVCCAPKEVVAVSEAGLRYFLRPFSRDAQRGELAKQCQLAKAVESRSSFTSRDERQPRHPARRRRSARE